MITKIWIVIGLAKQLADPDQPADSNYYSCVFLKSADQEVVFSDWSKGCIIPIFNTDK